MERVKTAAANANVDAAANAAANAAKQVGLTHESRLNELHHEKALTNGCLTKS